MTGTILPKEKNLMFFFEELKKIPLPSYGISFCIIQLNENKYVHRTGSCINELCFVQTKNGL